MRKYLHFAFWIATPMILLTRPALSGEGGSGYSRYGIGDIRYFAGARSAGMGGTSISLLNLNSINWLNPAGQAKFTRTLFGGTFSYEGFRTSDGIQSAYLSSGNFGGAALVVPLSIENGLTLMAGFTPYSKVNYKVQLEEELASESYTQVYSGEGGLSTALLGISLSPVDSLHVGLRFNYVFGQTRRVSDVTFASPDLAPVKYRRTVNVNGFLPTLGVIYTGFGHLTGLEGLSSVTVGGILSSGANLDAIQEEVNAGSAGEDTVARRDGNIRIPVSGGLGISWVAGGKYLFAGDVFYQKWGDLRYFNERLAQIRNSARYSLGMEVLPSTEGRASYWQRVAYRFGISYLSSYYQIGAQAINEVTASAGIGLPVGFDSRLDFAIEYGNRGTTDQHLLKDNIIRFSVTLSAGERWFIRSEED